MDGATSPPAVLNGLLLSKSSSSTVLETLFLAGKEVLRSSRGNNPTGDHEGVAKQ